MSKRIKSLKESPCYQCNCDDKCNKKIRKNYIFSEIKDAMFGNAEYDYHDCPIWIALNAPEMVEVEDED